MNALTNKTTIMINAVGETPVWKIKKIIDRYALALKVYGDQTRFNAFGTEAELKQMATALDNFTIDTDYEGAYTKAVNEQLK